MNTFTNCSSIFRKFCAFYFCRNRTQRKNLEKETESRNRMIILTILRHNFNTTLKQTKVHGTSLVIIYKTHTQDSIDKEQF